MRQSIGITIASLLAIPLVIAVHSMWETSRRLTLAEDFGLIEIDNGDVQFWLFQGEPNNRFIPCTVQYHFDHPLDESLLLERLRELTAAYQMFSRNVVEINGLPYWQSVSPDWQENFRRLAEDEDEASVREAADTALSQAQAVGEGLPLFRVYLSADGRTLTFMWHHVISDFEGMFNKHARHLFRLDEERTRFGYQIADAPDGATESRSSRSLSLGKAFSERRLGFEGTDFVVSRHLLPVRDNALFELGQVADLPMSDIFSFITMRTVTRYHELMKDSVREDIRPVVSPLSLRTSSLEVDEGNNRAIKQFPLMFPLESVDVMADRIAMLSPSSSSYERAGAAMKFVRKYPVLESPFRRMVSPDYISNYFPLSDGPLSVGEARLVSHDLRVPMVPYERTKFAWSNYDGEVQLFLHTDPVLVDADLMARSFQQSATEVLAYLEAIQ
jgi:hypothetical protein